MNEDLLTPDDICMLDRLVDGELNESDRRTLLLRLEHSPDGWRRCALAFLEAQAWRVEARAVVAEPAPIARLNEAASGAPTIQPAGLGRKTWNGLSVWVPSVLAAGILVAVVYPQFIARPNNSEFRPGAFQSNPHLAVGTPGYETVAGRNGEKVRLVVAPGPGGEQRVVEVPLIEPERLNSKMFGEAGVQLSPEMIRALEQNGNHVTREHRFMPITLDDGRRAVVPVEQVEIRPASIQGFQ